MKTVRNSLFALLLLIGTLIGGVWLYAGRYGVGVLFRHGGTWWFPVAADSFLLSPSMRLALASTPPVHPGPLSWRNVAPGFDVAELQVRTPKAVVDRIYLARIDSGKFRFVVRNAPGGDYGLDQWMDQLGAALVVNGSYYARTGKPDTPVLSNGLPLGPHSYDAKAGAFVASTRFAGVKDLSQRSWQSAFKGADNAMVSYPLLLANGRVRVTAKSQWLANRSFIGQDAQGHIIIGTTTDAFFSLARLAEFLRTSPIGLRNALNLDGGPVASQAIRLNGYRRETHGHWEAQVRDGKVRLLAWPYGTVAMPIVLAVFPK